jgi:hypothetical protein
MRASKSKVLDTQICRSIGAATTSLRLFSTRKNSRLSESEQMETSDAAASLMSRLSSYRHGHCEDDTRAPSSRPSITPL